MHHDVRPGCGRCRRPHLPEDGHDIRTVQELLGHRSVKTAMIDTHLLNRSHDAVTSLLDRLALEAPPD